MHDLISLTQLSRIVSGYFAVVTFLLCTLHPVFLLRSPAVIAGSLMLVYYVTLPDY